jgi:riboflavin biosynthesis pyrimidine reductase
MPVTSGKASGEGVWCRGAGKIASSTGHAAWVSSELSRERVFSTRAVSDAVIVGGNTVRRDSMYL